MLSSSDVERLIAVKRREIVKEKTHLGLALTSTDLDRLDIKNVKEQEDPKFRRVKFTEDKILASNDETQDKKERDGDIREEAPDLDERIPPDLERYIRRYIGLPVMLKAGEYSPNNPLIRAERNSGDALLGLGEYERRRNTLRKLRQQQYREYLDQQAKKKQEEKERAERERREREKKEREREERERERERERELLERERESPRRRASVSCGGNSPYYIHKVDTGVQVDSVRSPLSVAVQTDDADLFQLPPSPTKTQLTEAERELSPRTVDHDERRIAPAWIDKWKDNAIAERRRSYGDFDDHKQSHNGERRIAPAWIDKWEDNDIADRRRSYGNFDERSSTLRPSRTRLLSDLRHSYMPSIFDADAIHMRNLQAEKEAAERRQYYQKELKNQIMEQQRIKEERRNREKMLEEAEMRRLEEQLRMLKMAQDREVGKQREITAAIHDENIEYSKKRKALQKEIDMEQQSLLRATTHPPLVPPRMTTSHSDTLNPSTLPFYYPRTKDKDKPYSMNIPDNSIFSPNYDVDSYLRKNLNFKNINRFDANKKVFDNKNKFDANNIERRDAFEDKKFDNSKNFDFDDRNSLDTNNIENKNRGSNFESKYRFERKDDKSDVDLEVKRFDTKNLDIESIGDNKDRKVIVEKALIHEPKERKKAKNIECDDTPIPVLRHSPVLQADKVENDLSDAMQLVDDKWKVPAVQKNILRSLPNEEGKNVSILTQLGSIRRQLQLEQLKLDRMGKGDA